MKKKCLIVLLLQVLYSLLVAQEYMPSYKLIYTNNNGALPKTQVELNYIMMSNGAKSFGYIMPIMQKDSNGTLIENDKVYIKQNNVDTQRIYYFKDFETRSLLFETGVNQIFERNLVFADTLCNFNWRLINEVQKIDSFTCFKAECDFRGRKYTAWYTTSIPLFDGPWKFCGLPGLIIKVNDPDNAVDWKLIELTNSPQKMIEFPKSSNGVYKDFLKIVKPVYQRFIKILESSENAKDPSCAGYKSYRTVKNRMPELFDY